MPAGFVGRYCVIDLSSGTHEVVEPEENFYRHYLGGYGLGAAVIMERQPASVDPLAAESYLGFCSGLLTGSGALFAGRYMVVGKSPLTGGWGDANAGGYFSREIKRTGYDAIFFTGAAAHPVWVVITEAGIDIRDGEALWGQDIVETEKWIKAQLDDPNVQVAAIGESGEKRSLISGIATDGGRIAARSGLGAVMGSKKLKAVVLRGKHEVKTARPDTIKQINKAFRQEYKKSSPADRLTLRFMNPISKIIARTGISVPATPSLIREIFKRYGTSGLTVYSAMTGDMPIKNWKGVGYIDYTAASAAKNSDESVLTYQRRKYACQSCPLACGGIIDIPRGRFAGTRGHKPEYETLGAFGGLILHDDLDAIIELNEMCNRAGIDTISAGATVAFAIECYDTGIIDATDTGGLELGWGKSAEILALTEMLIKREGIGDVLADGVKAAAAKIGRGAERFAVHAGGQELPMHDTRLDPGYAIAYQCEPTPGRHTISCYLYAGLFGVEKNFKRARQMVKAAKGPMAKKVSRYAAGSIYMQLVNAAGLCLFGAMTSRLPVVDWINAATGWDLSADDYYTAGERVLSLRKAFNAREGLGPLDSRLSRRALGTTPMTRGPLKGVSFDMDAMMAEFHRIMGWDPATAGPSAERQKALGIDHLMC